MMSGKGWHSGGRRSVGDDLTQISAHCQGRGVGAKQQRRVMPLGRPRGKSSSCGSAAAVNLGLHPSSLPVLE